MIHGSEHNRETLKNNVESKRDHGKRDHVVLVLIVLVLLEKFRRVSRVSVNL